MQRSIPAVLMRGGTSKGLFFHEHHLPAEASIRDQVILAAYGSPDPNRRQIDGVGGAASTSSKVAIISPSANPAYDVVYNFGQVAIDRPIIDYKGNCGNISAAVGPFAVDEGLVKAVEPITRVRIHQKNTNKLIVAEVPIKNGRFNEEGDYQIAGVPGSHSRIDLRFALTGKLFPTGNASDTIVVPGYGEMAITIIDAANPVVLVRAEALGLQGTETQAIDASNDIRKTLETIRCKAAVLIGLVATEQEASERSQAVPKMAFISAPQAYHATSGHSIAASEVDLVARIMSMGYLHPSYAVSGGIGRFGVPIGQRFFQLLRLSSHRRKILCQNRAQFFRSLFKLQHIPQGPNQFKHARFLVGKTRFGLLKGPFPEHGPLPTHIIFRVSIRIQPNL